MSPPYQTKTLPHGINALVAGENTPGAPIILLPGWPETAEAFADIIPALSAQRPTFALDPPGLGDSAPASAYDTENISSTLHASVAGVIKEGGYHLVGHDVGAWIAYAWASRFPQQMLSLTLLDSAVPGLAAPLTYPLPAPLNVKLWQFSFNALPDLPEILTLGRERELLDWLFDRKAQHPEGISRARRDRYVECYARPGAMSRGFAYYRAVGTSAEQNREGAKGEGGKLQMPVLALGGETATGEGLKRSLEELAVDVSGGQVEDCGHYLMEEQPGEIGKRLVEFFEEVERR